MHRFALLLVLALVATSLSACASRRVGKRVPGARPDKAIVKVEGTRRVRGQGGDVGYDVQVVRVDGAPARGTILTLDPGPHEVQLRWSRVELETWGLHRDLEVSTRWAKTAGGCCTVDVDVRGGRVYTIVWDDRRTGSCPMAVREVPLCGVPLPSDVAPPR